MVLWGACLLLIIANVINIPAVKPGWINVARWARRLSWKETAEAFRSSWDKVFDAVEHLVIWGLEHRTLGQIDAIGVDEIQYSKGHKYLTLVYQIDLGITRLLWVGKERTIESFHGFFTTIGEEITSKIVFIGSDMWEPYLESSSGEISTMNRRRRGFGFPSRQPWSLSSGSIFNESSGTKQR